MKFNLYILAFVAIAFYSCKKESTLNDQNDNIVVVNAHLEVNQPIKGIKLSALTPLGEENQVLHDDLSCEIIRGDEVYSLSVDNKGLYYYDDESVIIEPNTGYELKITGKEDIVRAYTITPQNREGVVVSKSNILTTTDFDQIDVEMLEVDGNEVFYLIRILHNEEAPEPIIFTEQSIPTPKEVFLYNGNNNTISLLSTYFQYYGSHTICIDRINEEYYDLFEDKYNQEFYLDEGNVINGKGLFVGKDRFTFNVDVL